MELNVEHVNQAGKLNKKYDLTLPAFLKHAAISGQGCNYELLPSLARGIGAMMYYGHYINSNWFLNFKGFKKSELKFYDPTEQGDFSTIVGKAIADFLAKEILKAKFTHSYEAAMHVMKKPIAGSRPDLYCTTSSQQFAIEAKGYSKQSVSQREMDRHISQSRSGLLYADLCVASVTYDIYNINGYIQCKFHESVGSNITFSRHENNALAKQYYLSLFNQLSGYIMPESYEFDNKQYDAYDLSPYFFLRHNAGRRVRLLLDTKIRRNLESDRIIEIEYPRISEQNIYLDADGVGIVID